MREDTGQWRVQLVRCTSVDSLDGFVTVVFDGGNPMFQFRGGELWKSACSIVIRDDGRMHVRAEKHLTARQRMIVAGLAEQYWRGGPESARRDDWRRIRPSKRRPVGARATCFWVRAEQGEPGYAAAHADFWETVVQAHPYAHDSRTTRWLEEGADEDAVAQ